MRKIFFLILLLVPMVATARVASPKHICGIVHFADGHEESFNYVKLPESNSQTLTVSAKGGKNLRTIAAEDVLSLTVWHVDHPEKTVTIYQLNYRSILKKSRKVYHLWGMPLMASEWGMVFRVSSSYQIEDKTGDFYTVTVQQNGVGSDGMILQCRDFQYAQWVGAIEGENNPEEGKYPVMSWLMHQRKVSKIFASNPRIAQQVYNQELKASDLQYILDQMALMPQEEAQKLAEEPTSGIANDFAFTNQFRLEYTNYLSSVNQNLVLAWEYDFQYFFMGLQAGFLQEQMQELIEQKYDYSIRDYYYVYDTISRPTLALGVRMGFQVPIRVAKKCVLVPRIMVAPTFEPLTFLSSAQGSPVIASLPFSLGSDFCFSVKKGVYLHAGIHYVYDISFPYDVWGIMENKNRVLLNEDARKWVDVAPAVGQSGIMANFAISW